MKIYLLSFIFIINLIICNETKEEKSDSNFIDWGIKNDIEISSLIGISSVNGVKKFVALEDIESKKEILTIPYDITFNIEKILDLLNSNELKTQYEKFEKLDIPTYEPHHINLQKEEIFLSYIFYLIQHEPNLYNNTKFYEKYKLYLSSIKNYLPKSPLFYNTEQIEYLSGTYLGKFHDRIKKLFQEEIKVLKNESYYNKDIDFKDYAYNRLFTQNKGLELLGHISMIPFLNLFDRDYIKFNARFIIERKRNVKIVTQKYIKKGEIIIVNSPKRSNVERMIFEGELNSYLVNYKENYIIPAFSPGLYYKYDIDDIELFNAYIINLIELDFDSKAINLYKNYSKLFKGDGGDDWAYGILLENINFYKDYVKSFINERIDKIFDDDYDRKHIEREMQGELKVLDRTLAFIKHKLDQYKKNEKKGTTDL
jgi:hypothetical protein